MKQNKLVIVVLVVIAILFILGLSLDFFRSEDNNDDKISMSKVEKLKSGWMASLDSTMARFQDSLDSSRLDPGPGVECSTGDATFKLTGSRKSCTVAIAARKKAGVQKAVLAVTPADVKVWIPYPKDEGCPSSTATRGTVMAMGKFKQPKAAIGVAKIKPGRIRPGTPPGRTSPGGSTSDSFGGTSQEPLRLDFIYTPEPADEVEQQMEMCEASGKVKLVVLEQGGTLELHCKDCDENRSITVVLE